MKGPLSPSAGQIQKSDRRYDAELRCITEPPKHPGPAHSSLDDGTVIFCDIQSSGTKGYFRPNVDDPTVYSNQAASSSEEQTDCAGDGLSSRGLTGRRDPHGLWLR